MLHAMENGNWFAMFLFWAIVWIAIIAIGVFIVALLDGQGHRHGGPRGA